METIRILTTGGTIDKVYFDSKSTYEVGDPQISEVLNVVNATVPYVVETVFQKDSLDITADDRRRLHDSVERAGESRILITHGTDTMAETGRELMNIENKTIVLVGSLSPARFKQTDAEFNIGFALCAVQTLPPGVYIAMNGRVFEASHVKKNRSENRFEETNP